MKQFLNYYNIKYSQKVTLLVCSFLLCLVMTTMLNTILASVINDNLLKINIGLLTQNIFAFILPVVLTVVFITPKPIEYLRLNKVPSAKSLLFLLATFVAMTPAFNYIVEWNNNISLPESMKSIETWMRNAEDSAQAISNMLLMNNNIIISILIIGVLTGLSEELLFRGGLQTLLHSRPMNIHIAIWLTAIIFSIMHFQFFGFVPRILLGAFFGYLAYWSGSLWTAIIAHALNNSTVIIAHHVNQNCGFNLDNVGLVEAGDFPVLALCSLIITALLICAYVKTRKG